MAAASRSAQQSFVACNSCILSLHMCVDCNNKYTCNVILDKYTSSHMAQLGTYIEIVYEIG